MISAKDIRNVQQAKADPNYAFWNIVEMAILAASQDIKVTSCTIDINYLPNGITLNEFSKIMHAKGYTVSAADWKIRISWKNIGI